MSDPIPATPHRFRFELRIIDEAARDAELALYGSGHARSPSPFANKAFRLVWGDRTFKGKTDDSGLVAVDIDGTAYSGTLELGVLDGDVFHAHLTIPVRSRSPEDTSTSNRVRIEALQSEIAMRLRNLGLCAGEDSGSIREALARYLYRGILWVDKPGSLSATWNRVDDEWRNETWLREVLGELQTVHDRAKELA